MVSRMSVTCGAGRTGQSVLLLRALVGFSAAIGVTAATPATGFVGQGSCGNHTCTFCPSSIRVSPTTLRPYGTTASDYGDRCAHGPFFHIVAVSADHATGNVAMCAGMKTAPNGSGGNAGSVGVTCSTSTKMVEASGYETAGYATIINWDSLATHYSFRGGAGYD
jgi:hypothetical protein